MKELKEKIEIFDKKYSEKISIQKMQLCKIASDDDLLSSLTPTIDTENPFKIFRKGEL